MRPATARQVPANAACSIVVILSAVPCLDFGSRSVENRTNARSALTPARRRPAAGLGLRRPHVRSRGEPRPGSVFTGGGIGAVLLLARGRVPYGQPPHGGWRARAGVVGGLPEGQDVGR